MSPLKLCSEFCVCVFSGPNRVYWSLPGLTVHETGISIVLGKEYVRAGADTTLHRQEQPGMETSQLAQAAPCTFPALTGAAARLLGREVRSPCSAMPHHPSHSIAPGLIPCGHMRRVVCGGDGMARASPAYFTPCPPQSCPGQRASSCQMLGRRGAPHLGPSLR